MNNYDGYEDLEHSLGTLISQANGYGSSADAIRGFLVALWNDRPFRISDLTKLDWQNTEYVQTVLNWHISQDYRWPRDFIYGDALRNLCEKNDKINELNRSN